MGASKNEVEIIVSLKDGFSKGFDLAQKRVTRLKDTVFSLKTAMVGLGAGLGVTALSTSFTEAAQKAEQLRLRLDNLLNSAEAGQQVFDNTTRYAKTVAHEFEQLMEVATALAGVMRGGPEEIAKWLPIISDLAAVSGLSLQETSSNFIRMYSAGAAAADLFRERGILALLDFHAKTEYTVEETRKKVIAAWEDVNSRFRGTADDLALTWKGLLSMMADRWFLFRLEVMNNDVFLAMKASLALVVDEFDRLSESGDLEKWAETIAETIMTSAKKITFALAGVYDTAAGLFKGISGIWAQLPQEVRQYGILGALINGKKGFAQGMAFGAIVDKFKQGSRELAIEIMLLAGDLDEASVAIYRSGKKTAEAYDKLLGINDIQKESFIAKTGVLGFLRLPDENTATKIVEKYWERLNAKSTELQATQAAKDAARTGEKLAPGGVSGLAIAKLGLAELRASTQTALAELDGAYRDSEISFDNYWATRSEKLKTQFDAELEQLQRLAEVETEPTKKAQAASAIFVKQQQYAQAELALIDEKWHAEQDLFDKRRELQDILKAIDQENAEASMSAFDQRMGHEQQVLEERQQYEYQLMMDHTAKLSDELQKRAAMEELASKHKGQTDVLLAKQETALRLDQLGTAQGVADGMVDISTKLFNASGRQNKKMFALMKAASVAQATIKTHEAVVGALGSPPYGWAAIANAALAGAMGAAEIAAIMSQQLADGGTVLGHSPHSRADNIPIQATAGEFMQPVSTVQHYGLDAMEAIRQKRVPREVFLGLGGLVPKRAYGFAADGGQIAGGLKNLESDSTMQAPKVEIINVTNPDAIRGLAMDTLHDNRDTVVNMVLDGLEERNINLQKAYS